MKQQQFEKTYSEEWALFERLLKGLSAIRKKRSREEMQIDSQLEKAWQEFPERYRRICQQLALAKDRHYTANLINRLNRLALEGHQHLYQQNRLMIWRVLEYFIVDFPAAVRRDYKLVVLSILLFYGPMFFTGTLVYFQPEMIYTVLDQGTIENVENMYDPGKDVIGRERSSDTDVMMFGHYIRNNTGIGFQTFAGGMLVGLGTIFYLIYNGLFIGAIAGHLTQIGYIETFYPFVVGHSSFELTAIVLAGSSGLKLGLSILLPGRRRRLESLKKAAQESLFLVYGMAAMFFIAAFIEAFWSSTTSLAPEIKYSVGGGLWFIVIVYFLFAGRRRAAG